MTLHLFVRFVNQFNAGIKSSIKCKKKLIYQETEKNKKTRSFSLIYVKHATTVAGVLYKFLLLLLSLLLFFFYDIT